MLLDAVHKLRLLDPDPQVRRQAVEFCCGPRRSGAESAQEATRQETDAQVHTAVTGQCVYPKSARQLPPATTA